MYLFELCLLMYLFYFGIHVFVILEFIKIIIFEYMYLLF